MEFVYDDGGREAAGYKKMSGDCVSRAIAIATEQDYKDVFEFLSSKCSTQRKTRKSRKLKDASKGVYTRRKWFHDYMNSLGFLWFPTMQIGKGCRVHLKREELPQEGRLIVCLSKHLVAVVDGVIHDTGDPSREGTRCVYGYWSRNLFYTKNVLAVMNRK